MVENAILALTYQTAVLAPLNPQKLGTYLGHSVSSRAA